MLLDKINNATLVQEKTLDAAWLRNEVLSHNLANVDTPTYNRKDVDFEKYLRAALMQHGSDETIFHLRHDFRFKEPGPPDISGIHGVVREEYNTMAMRIDGNNIDVDEEMAQMAINSIKYNVVTYNAASKLSKIKHAITEGRR
jgi:flagellar basal-body rod protein FlgB